MHIKPFYKVFLIQAICLTLLAFIVHAVVLKFIFPGYYSPLYPHHSDFYIPVALANSPEDFFQYRYLGYSRPLAIFFIKCLGFLGVKGYILFAITNVMVNCAISALLIRRLLNIEFKAPFIFAYLVYCFLLFSQPYFYTFYTHDLLSHLSYFMLLIGVILFLSQYKKSIARAAILLFLFSLIAFLCKETYSLAFLFLGLVAFAYCYKKMSIARAALPFISIVSAVLVVVMFNLLIKSVFINFNSTATDPYHIIFTPSSIIKELILYAGEAFGYPHWILIVGMLSLVGFFIWTGQKRFAALLVACVIAGVLSWIPNTLIPNHHNGGYSFNGAYLFYLPILSIPLLKSRNVFVPVATAILLGVCLFIPSANRKAYANQWWVLEQETTQRNILQSLPALYNGVVSTGQTQKILVAGLTMPFFPFHHPRMLLNYPNSSSLEYDVISYSASASTEREQGVKYILPTEVDLNEYTSVWMFGGDGSLLGSILLDKRAKEIIAVNAYQDILINPKPEKTGKLISAIKK